MDAETLTFSAQKWENGEFLICATGIGKSAQQPSYMEENII